MKADPTWIVWPGPGSAEQQRGERPGAHESSGTGVSGRTLCLFCRRAPVGDERSERPGVHVARVETGLSRSSAIYIYLETACGRLFGCLVSKSRSSHECHAFQFSGQRSGSSPGSSGCSLHRWVYDQPNYNGRRHEVRSRQASHRLPYHTH